MMKRTLLIIILVSATTCFAQKQVRSAIREGNSYYNREAYLDSEISYRRALEANPVDSLATFNLGNSLYRQQDNEKIQESLSHYIATAQRAQDGGNKELAAKAFYNAGDVMMAAQQYDKAINLYKQSLKNDPSDHEARYNLLLAQRLLQQQQDQNKDQNQDQQQQNQQDQQDQQQDQNQQNQQDQQQDQQNQDQNQQDPPENKDQQQQQDQQMSKEQAEAILNANNRDEKDTQQKVQEKLMQQIKRKQTNRDW